MDAQREARAIATIRALALDAVQKANSGHPGTAMALAPLAHVLWTRVMSYDASDPDWPDRDRFVLSCGHASILQYIMLYLTGTILTLDDLKAFRQWQSRTPGHPERMHVKGVDTTTGPLGQGFANAVGMALAERSMRSRFGSGAMDHYIFGICSDGDLQEGISHEAASLAGHQRLGRLIFVYDDNHITIDGDTDLSFSDDTPARFSAYGWHVDNVGEIANDCDALESAIRRAMQHDDKPSLIVLRSHIGYPSPKFTDSPAAHGSPLGEEEVRNTKLVMGRDPEKTFDVPDDVLALYRDAGARGAKSAQAWRDRVQASEFDRAAFTASLDRKGLPGWENLLPHWEVGKAVATREALAACLDATWKSLPGLFCGGGDLTGNTGTAIKGAPVVTPDTPGGVQMYWGIREHALAAAMNGAAMHGGVLPIGGTFFVFSDYQRPALRLAEMNNAHAIFVWSHDSIGVGEDGPTHQPIEHLASLRAIPGFRVLRPADANETAAALKFAIDTDGPVGLVLTRQKLPVLPETAELSADDLWKRFAKGAYVLQREPDGQNIDVILLATGSEVSLACDAASMLADHNKVVRVVSMPSWELFEAQDETYQCEVLPEGVPRVSIEAASSFGWSRWADAHVAIDHFGASAPGSELFEKFGFTAENVTKVVLAALQ